MRVFHRSEGFARICHIWKIRASPSQRRGLTRISHICEKVAQILHMCDKYVQIFHTCDRFVWLSHSNEAVTGVKNSQVFVTREKFEQILHRYDKNVQILHTSKIRHLWKNSYLLKSHNWSYVYFTHTKMWHIRASNSQSVKHMKCEY